MRELEGQVRLEGTPEQKLEKLLKTLARKVTIDPPITGEHVQKLAQSGFAEILDTNGVLDEINSCAQELGDAAAILLTLRHAADVSPRISRSVLSKFIEMGTTTKDIVSLIVRCRRDMIDGFKTLNIAAAINFFRSIEPPMNFAAVLARHPHLEGALVCPSREIVSALLSKSFFGGTYADVEQALKENNFSSLRLINDRLVSEYKFEIKSNRGLTGGESARAFLRDKRTKELLHDLRGCADSVRGVGNADRYEMFSDMLLRDKLVTFSEKASTWAAMPDFEYAAGLAFQHLLKTGSTYTDSQPFLKEMMSRYDSGHYNRYIAQARERGLDVESGARAERFERFCEFVLDDVLRRDNLSHRIHHEPVPESMRADNAKAVNNAQHVLLLRKLNMSMRFNMSDRVIVLYSRPGVDDFWFFMAYKILDDSMKRGWFSVFNNIKVVSRDKGEYPKFIHDIGLPQDDYLPVKGKAFRAATSYAANTIHFQSTNSLKDQIQLHSIPIATADARSFVDESTDLVPLRASISGRSWDAEAMEHGEKDPVRFAFEVLHAVQRAEETMLQRARK